MGRAVRGELRWQSRGNDRPAVRYLCLINSTLLKIIYEGRFVCVRQTVLRGIHPLHGPRSLQLCECSRFIEFILTSRASLWMIMIIFFSPFLFFCSDYARILFVLSGLLQIKEQNNRSCAWCLLLYDCEALAGGDSAISKGHRLPWLWRMCGRAGAQARGLRGRSSLFSGCSLREPNQETFIASLNSFYFDNFLWKCQSGRDLNLRTCPSFPFSLDF